MLYDIFKTSDLKELDFFLYKKGFDFYNFYLKCFFQFAFV